MWHSFRYRNDPRNPEGLDEAGCAGLPGDVWVKSLTLNLADEFGFASVISPETAAQAQPIGAGAVDDQAAQQSPCVSVAYSNPMGAYYTDAEGADADEAGVDGTTAGGPVAEEPRGKNKTKRMRDYGKFYGAYAGEDGEGDGNAGGSVYSDEPTEPVLECPASIYADYADDGEEEARRSGATKQKEARARKGSDGDVPAAAYGSVDGEAEASESESVRAIRTF